MLVEMAGLELFVVARLPGRNSIMMDGIISEGYDRHSATINTYISRLSSANAFKLSEILSLTLTAAFFLSFSIFFLLPIRMERNPVE